MATSFYDFSVPTFLQTVKAIRGFLDFAVSHCAATRADPDDFVHARLFDNMAPFHFQIEAAWHHAVWGLEAVRTGVFAPPAVVGPVPFGDLQAMISKAETALQSLSRGHPDPGRYFLAACHHGSQIDVNANLKLTHPGDKRQSKSDPPWAPFGIKLMPFSLPSDRLFVYL